MVDPAEGFVEQHHGCLLGERSRQVRALQLPARQLAERHSFGAIEVHAGQAVGGDLAIPNQAVKTDWRFLFAGCPAATYVKGNGVRHADFTKPRKSEPKL